MRNKWSRFTFLWCLSLLWGACGSESIIAEKLTDYVQLNIGTAHSRWFFYTPAAVPFGMAKPAPSTNGHEGNKSGWEAVGYDSRHTSIEGFANFHEFQIGGIVCAPTTGTLKTVPGALDSSNEGYRSAFDKKDEFATSGYYSVFLKDYGIKAELTATKRVAFHRYTYPANKEGHLIFDIGNQQGESGKVSDAKVKINADGSIEGWVTTLPEYVKKYQKGASLSMYFYAVPDQSPVATGTFIGKVQQPDKKEVNGKGAGAYLTFAAGSEKKVVNIKIGLSYTSVANAKNNLQKEAADLSFDKAKENALTTWEEHLGRIAVDKIKFYTGLYHALLGRGLASDVNGAYPKNDGGIGQISLGENGQPIHHHYNTDAIWGAFWNLTQLWSIAYPEYLQDWVQSQLLIYKDAGWLGDGIAASRYVSGVGTNYISLVAAAAYNSGLRNFDVDLGYKAALKNEIDWQNRPAGAGKVDLKAFLERGFIPFDESYNWLDFPDGSHFGTSHSLEYSFSSYAVAQWAKALGKKEDYAKLMQLSQNWKKSFDPETQFIRPRRLRNSYLLYNMEVHYLIK
ncbi:putative alpha-1,2-mannosidase [Pedobacter sp. CG_S7]|uniref:glycoside hydrolase domain-containing protein n=1 Tax=Pedobacter sp. CG_S7 TaxID=3143930 RepID=UPI003399BED3